MEKKSWYIIDASDKTLGRLASSIARILIGKHKTNYAPHFDVGDYVVIINAKKINITGRKREEKKYYHHSGYPGGIKTIVFKDLMNKHPQRIIELAVKGMLPRNKLLKNRLKRLKIYLEGSHPHKAQIPEVLEIK